MSNLVPIVKNNRKYTSKNITTKKIIIREEPKPIFTFDKLTELGVYGLSFIYYKNNGNITEARKEIRSNMYHEMLSTSNKDKIVIVTNGGLCNRLRTIFTYYRKASMEKKKLIVIWKIDIACPGFFLDYFDPIDNISFFKDNSNNYSIDYNGVFGYPDFTNNKLYSKLKLLSHIDEKVKTNIKLFNNNYISIHVRRTDFITSGRNIKYSFYEEFLNKNNQIIYLATDNRDTQNYFINKYKDRIKMINLIDSKNNQLRNTTLENSIIDIYICVYSQNFLGTPGSSFSELIYRLRDELIINKYIVL